MNELADIIGAEIQRAGPMGFDRFMDLALYHPGLGYYRRERPNPRTGREGDFYTSVSIGPLFGRLLARQFSQMWELLGRPFPFWIIEQGAEEAQLACDILDWARTEMPSFFEAIRYGIIESSESLRAKQSKRIATAHAGKVTWFPDERALAVEPVIGVLFSNELVDAFPVRVITRRENAWRERRITVADDGRFRWSDRPIEDSDLAGTIKDLPLPLLEGYTTEIHLRARKWMQDVGRVMTRGYVVTLDYGFPAEIYYADFRIGGTLTAYRQHRRSEEVLAEPGGNDITAHVEFTGLARAGEKAGLTTLGFLDQQHFLMGIAHEEMSGADVPRTGIAENVRAWQTLTHPGYLGARFQALVQAKDASRELECLRYSRPASL